MKRLTATIIWAAIACLSSAGCISQLDKDLYAVDKQLRGACEKYVTVVQVSQTIGQRMADKKHALEQATIDHEVNGFIAEHSKPNGEMFNYVLDASGKRVLNADGTPKTAPLNAAVLLKVIADRDAKMSALRESKRVWDDSYAQATKATEAFAAAVARVGPTMDSIMDAKQKGQDLAEKLGTAGGALIGGLLAGSGL